MPEGTITPPVTPATTQGSKRPGLHAHPRAMLGGDLVHGHGIVIGEGAIIADGCALGSFVVVEAGARIGTGTRIGNHVTVCAGANIGEDCVISDFAVVGKQQVLSAASPEMSERLPGVVLGQGCTVGSHAIVMAGAIVGKRVMLGDGAYVTAHTIIEDDAFIAPMVVTSNDNHMGRSEKALAEIGGPTVRRGARVGAGSMLLPGVEVGEEAFVAVGSIVTRDVAPRTLVMGAPAQARGDVSSEEFAEG